jgi:hypothetical protein
VLRELPKPAELALVFEWLALPRGELPRVLARDRAGADEAVSKVFPSMREYFWRMHAEISGGVTFGTPHTDERTWRRGLQPTLEHLFDVVGIPGQAVTPQQHDVRAELLQQIVTDAADAAWQATPIAYFANPFDWPQPMLKELIGAYWVTREAAVAGHVFVTTTRDDSEVFCGTLDIDSPSPDNPPVPA